MNQLMLPLVFLLSPFVKWPVQMLLFPIDLYRFFSGERFVWLRYVAWAVGLFVLGYIVNAHFNPRDSFWLSILPFVWFSGVLFFICEKLENAREGSALAGMAFVPGTGTTLAAHNAGDSILRGSQVVNATHLSKNGGDTAMRIGGVAIAPKAELQHFLVSGTTGAGKTQAINAMLRTVREREQPAIIADVGGGFLSRFLRDGDLVLNPFDARDIGWSPFTEIRQPYDARRLARALVPDTEGPGGEWRTFAQSLLGELLRSQWEKGEHSVRRIYELFMSGEHGELAEVAKGTAASVMFHDGNEKMLNNTRATAGPFLDVWQYLPDDGKFSVRDYVRAAAEEGFSGWLYLTYRDDQVALMRNLVGAWLDLAVVEGLSLGDNDDRRLWYVMDELDSLGKVTNLKEGLTKLRKKGGVCVSGIQTISQLRTTYGHDLAQTMLGNMNNRLVMRASDGETAGYFEKELGQQEIKRWATNEGTSQQTMQMGNTQSDGRSEQRTVQSTVLASEIATLPDLHGYLTTPGSPIYQVKVEYVGMPQVAEAYEPQGAFA
ncbi:type IV secretion system DNA-binding domain-containing protein [Xanthomonas citri]|uniref:type IV secretion system DNA-binding domain-containing protein n=1 Tax=Xanthomonas citri TaxID=346 RepID=UPI00052F6BA7|nr:type IV secretion system DNA-binding domain-containing protein [Xanthomonas citri]CEH93772.1 TraD protein [Xanthomonas citri pv. citri]